IGIPIESIFRGAGCFNTGVQVNTYLSLMKTFEQSVVHLLPRLPSFLNLSKGAVKHDTFGTV
ncbi:hypothetical protein, partial, partial [Absidia glauca]